MIVSRFGSTWAGAYMLPNAMMVDDFGTDLQALSARVGGLDGEFDFHGDDANPIGPVTVKKTAIITATSWAGVETSLDALRAATIAVAESKLWLLMRDGSHRWAWAKCVGLSDPDRTGQFLHCPIEITFYLPEGLWYSETLHTTSSIADNSSSVLNNAGNVRATLTAETGGGAAISATSINNTTNGSGYTLNLAAVAGYGLSVDPAAYAIDDLIGSADYFSILTPNIPGQLWLTLDPGDNTIVRASTGGAANGWVLTWYDTWVL